MTAITVEDLDNAQIDVTLLAEVATSRLGGVSIGSPIDEATTRLGDSINTVQGQLAKLGFKIPAVNWMASTSVISNIQVYRFPAGTGDFYVAKVPVPFVTGVSFTTSNWQPLAVATADSIVDTFAGNGIQTDFALSETPSGVDNIQAFVNGIFQSPSLYVLLDETVTFTTAPPSGISDNVVIITSKNVTVSESFAADAAASAAAAAISETNAAADAASTAADVIEVTGLVGSAGSGTVMNLGRRFTGSASFIGGRRF